MIRQLCRRSGSLTLAVICALIAGGCSTGADPKSATPPPVIRTSSGVPATSVDPGQVSPTSAGLTSAAPGGYDKVLVVMEENRGYGDIIGSPEAPYLNQLAHQFGSAIAYDAGYPAECPSLAAYLLLTSGSDHGICDDDGPDAHPVTGDNLFQQVAVSGRQWRVYAESMPAPCTPANVGHYLVRHTAAPYFLTERTRCTTWDLPMGSVAAGALHDDLAAGHLPALSVVVPDACHDMHGGHGCPDDHLVSRGDTWLRDWIPAILAGADYRAGKLVVVITWDESSSTTDNHIPTLVISPTTAHVEDLTAQTHCTMLRTIEDLLHLPALGCAKGVAPATSRFGLQPR